MPRKDARRRALYNTEVGKVRGDLYRRALDRASVAHAQGFDLEAIALVESLMADRLESVLSLIAGQPARFGTVGEAARELDKPHNLLERELLEDVILWSHDRARWLHEFAKVPDGDDVTWEDRLADASRVASEGLALLNRVSVATNRLVRAWRAAGKDAVESDADGSTP